MIYAIFDQTIKQLEPSLCAGELDSVRRGMRLRFTLAIVPLVLLFTAGVTACDFVRGYFYEVTALKGRVVGTLDHHIFAPRWLRQSFKRKLAKLALYEFREPWDKTLLVKTVEADDQGSFDFGPLKFGHYTLRIDNDNSFDVEIKDLPQKTESVTIDVSPVETDCTGGHEFIVKTK